MAQYQWILLLVLPIWLVLDNWVQGLVLCLYKWALWVVLCKQVLTHCMKSTSCLMSDKLLLCSCLGTLGIPQSGYSLSLGMDWLIVHHVLGELYLVVTNVPFCRLGSHILVPR